jgi:hypothetical protein
MFRSRETRNPGDLPGRCVRRFILDAAVLLPKPHLDVHEFLLAIESFPEKHDESINHQILIGVKGTTSYQM